MLFYNPYEDGIYNDETSTKELTPEQKVREEWHNKIRESYKLKPVQEASISKRVLKPQDFADVYFL
jgi:hypothetical protein